MDIKLFFKQNKEKLAVVVMSLVLLTFVFFWKEQKETLENEIDRLVAINPLEEVIDEWICYQDPFSYTVCEFDSNTSYIQPSEKRGDKFQFIIPPEWQVKLTNNGTKQPKIDCSHYNVSCIKLGAPQ